ncbi:MAG: hypothetical protein J6X33_05015 [Clostridiales bacterium]|nr:hypothetical protein [Clostridiales bacterium]
MNDHYQDYLKKSVSAADLVFDEIKDADKALVKRVREKHIKDNTVYLLLLIVGFSACTWYFFAFLMTPSESLVYQIVSLTLLGAGSLSTGNLIYGILAGIKGIRKGVVLTASRVQEVKDERNKTYQYVFDIYMEDRDETLMSYSVGKEVFAQAEPGDGVIIVKAGRKIKVMEDPDRKGVMDVSNIKSGV